MRFSIVILTYNRPEELLKNVSEMAAWLRDLKDVELIVVDNNSSVSAKDVLKNFSFVRTICLDENVGVAARNEGIRVSLGEYIVTLDDDVFGFSYEDILRLERLFVEDYSLSAVNFKVVDEKTEEQVNWCHHRKLEVWSESEFETYEISEGAVAFRRKALDKSGLYPDYFFISHEGADLAIRLMNSGFHIIYSPEVCVMHSHAVSGRPGWRRYYYDTRNLLWLSARCYRLDVAIRKIFIGLLSLLVYSIRDGYFTFWIKGLYHGFMKISIAFNDRQEVSPEVWKRYLELEKNNPSFYYMVKKRLFKSNVRI